MNSIEHPQSPDGLWAKHGYTIQREPRGYGSSMIRTITAPDGEAVLVDAGFDGEMQWIRENLEAENAGLPDNDALTKGRSIEGSL